MICHVRCDNQDLACVDLPAVPRVGDLIAFVVTRGPTRGRMKHTARFVEDVVWNCPFPGDAAPARVDLHVSPEGKRVRTDAGGETVAAREAASAGS